MVTVIAKDSFTDNRLGEVKRKQPFELSVAAAKPYIDAGLLDYAVDQKPNPQQPTGTPPSALPAGQALPQATAPKSKRGRKSKQAE